MWVVTCGGQKEPSGECGPPSKKSHKQLSKGVFHWPSTDLLQKGLHLQGSHGFGNELENDNSLELIIKGLLLLLYLHVCICVNFCHINTETRRGCARPPETGVKKQLWAALWVLGIKTGSSGRAAGALKAEPSLQLHGQLFYDLLRHMHR